MAKIQKLSEKKKICIRNKSFAYYSGFGGLELRYIEYGIDDYIYCISGIWSGKTAYHKLKVYTNSNGTQYIKLHGYRIPLSDCIRM